MSCPPTPQPSATAVCSLRRLERQTDKIPAWSMELAPSLSASRRDEGDARNGTDVVQIGEPVPAQCMSKRRKSDGLQVGHVPALHVHCERAANVGSQSEDAVELCTKLWMTKRRLHCTAIPLSGCNPIQPWRVCSAFGQESICKVSILLTSVR